MISRCLVGSFMALMICANLHTAVYAADGKLIPVRGPLTETETTRSTEEAFPAPSAKQQMYVFWLLGKMISYPIDKAEAFVRTQMEKPFFRPASSPGPAQDPFIALERGEIPPAPPVERQSRDR
jgi:hypothetical protein